MDLQLLMVLKLAFVLYSQFLLYNKKWNSALFCFYMWYILNLRRHHFIISILTDISLAFVSKITHRFVEPPVTDNTTFCSVHTFQQQPLAPYIITPRTMYDLCLIARTFPLMPSLPSSTSPLCPPPFQPIPNFSSYHVNNNYRQILYTI